MERFKFLPLLGRILIGAPFVMSGLGKLAAYGATVGYIAAMGLPVPPLAFHHLAVVNSSPTVTQAPFAGCRSGSLILPGATPQLEGCS